MKLNKLLAKKTINNLKQDFGKHFENTPKNYHLEELWIQPGFAMAFLSPLQMYNAKFVTSSHWLAKRSANLAIGLA